MFISWTEDKGKTSSDGSGTNALVVDWWGLFSSTKECVFLKVCLVLLNKTKKLSCGLTLLAILWQMYNDEDGDNDGFQVPTLCAYIASHVIYQDNVKYSAHRYHCWYL